MGLRDNLKFPGQLCFRCLGQGQGRPCHEEGLRAQLSQPQSNSGCSHLQGKKSTFLKVDACFKKFDKDKDGMLNFVEFKNFMGKRKSLPDKVNLQETLDSHYPVDTIVDSFFYNVDCCPTLDYNNYC